jgi:hypothetical protein
VLLKHVILGVLVAMSVFHAASSGVSDLSPLFISDVLKVSVVGLSLITRSVLNNACQFCFHLLQL